MTDVDANTGITGPAGNVELIQINDDETITLLTDTRTSLYTSTSTTTYAKFQFVERLTDTKFALTYAKDAAASSDDYHGKVVIVDYDITSGLKFYDNSESEWRHFDTHAEMATIETVAQDDIIDGQNNVFAEIWTMESDGADGNQIIYRNAITQGFIDNAKDWMYCRMLVADGTGASADGFALTGANNQWTNCVAHDCDLQGFDVDVSTIIKNSIMFNNTGNDMHVKDDAGVTITGDHNRFEDAGCTDPGAGTYTDGDGDLTSKTTDPFIAAASDNFRLLPAMTLVIDGGEFVAGTPYSSAITDAYSRAFTNSDGTAIGYGSMGAYVFMDTVLDFAGRTVIDEATGLVPTNDVMPIGAYKWIDLSGSVNTPLGLGL